MGLRLGLVVAALLTWSVPAGAVYVDAVPPPTWSKVGSQWVVDAAKGTAANTSWFHNRAVSNVAVNVGGRAVTMPAAMRFAANVGQYVVPVIRANPSAWAITGIATLLAPIVWDAVQDRWEVPGGPGAWVCTNDGHACTQDGALQHLRVHEGYNPAIFNVVGTSYSEPSPGCKRWTFTMRRNWENYNWGSPAVTWCGQQQPGEPREANDEDWALVPPRIPEFWPENLPEDWPGAVPGVPLPIPVELPAINPSDDPIPVRQPWRVPVGDPVPVPDSDPAEWRQPVVDVKPSPVQDRPWRVDLQPKDIPVDDADGLTEPGPIEGGDPVGVPNEQQQQLCEVFPDIVACIEPGEAEDSELPEQEIQSTFTPEGGFGAGTASCPAPQQLATGLAGTLQVSWQPMCDFVSALRPIVIAIAGLSAALIFLGGFKED